MLDILLYSTLTCAQTDAIILRMETNEFIDVESKIELVKVVRESTPECYWDAND
jgi:hypothetical protein